MRSSRQDLRVRLMELAGSQAGYFTAAQARELGYSYQAQKYHVDHGNWLRVDRGIFRVVGWPSGPSDSLVRWVLWTRQLGAVSHDTAATVWDVGVANPVKVHLTVPPGFRSSDDLVVLHRAVLAPDDVTVRDAVRVTTPLRTLLDLAESSSADPNIAVSAIDDAVGRGLVTRRALREHAGGLSPGAAALIDDALSERRAS